MNMNPPTSRIILDVERAAEELRRGQGVIVQDKNTRSLLFSGEHYPDQTYITESSLPAVQLLKLAGLLPRAVFTPLEEQNTEGLLTISAEAIAAYPTALAASLTRVSEANVPLPETSHARFIAYRPKFGHEEHLAIVVGDPANAPAPLVRLHSSCVTGDIFASLRCDCGSQLHKALRTIAEEGAGIVLYLQQEGRGIGIANKLRAYALQDQGMDTVESNLALGFAPDERDFAIAATMLKDLGVSNITLLSNNPFKVEAMTQHGITVASRRAITTTPTAHNQNYLTTKAEKMGHLLTVSPCDKD